MPPEIRYGGVTFERQQRKPAIRSATRRRNDNIKVNTTKLLLTEGGVQAAAALRWECSVDDTKTYVACLVWVRNLVSYIRGRTSAKGVRG